MLPFYIFCRQPWLTFSLSGHIWFCTSIYDSLFLHKPPHKEKGLNFVDLTFSKLPITLLKEFCWWSAIGYKCMLCSLGIKIQTSRRCCLRSTYSWRRTYASSSIKKEWDSTPLSSVRLFQFDGQQDDSSFVCINWKQKSKD